MWNMLLLTGLLVLSIIVAIQGSAGKDLAKGLKLAAEAGATQAELIKTQGQRIKLLEDQVYGK